MSKTLVALDKAIVERVVGTAIDQWWDHKRDETKTKLDDKAIDEMAREMPETKGYLWWKREYPLGARRHDARRSYENDNDYSSPAFVHQYRASLQMARLEDKYTELVKIRDAAHFSAPGTIIYVDAGLWAFANKGPRP